MPAQENDAAAGRRAQAKAEAIVHGTVDPKSVTGRPRPTHAPAGAYELVAGVWNEPCKDEHGRRFTKRHVRGAIVELDSDNASRLLRAGAVKPVTADGEDFAETLPKSAQEKAADYAAEHPMAVPAGDDTGSGAVVAPTGTDPGTRAPRIEG